MNTKFAIGIDPGRNTGLCAWNRPKKRILYLKTVYIHEAMKQVEAWVKENPNQIFVRFEDARLRKWIPRQENEIAERGMREGAGSVKRDCVIWEDFLESLGVPYERVAPKNNRTKVKADKFKIITGFEGRTSTHSRDAAMLVVGL